MSNIATDAIANDLPVADATPAEQTEVVTTTPAAEAAPVKETARDAAQAAAKALGIVDEPAKPADTKRSLTAPVVEITPEKRIDPITGAEVVPMRAPASWTPVLREKWGSIDPTVQKYIADRERDMASTLTKTAEDRTLAKEFREVLTPHDDVFKQHNVRAADHVKELLQISRVLNTGTPQQRAQQLHAMIVHFQPDATTLQALFAGQPVNVPAMQAAEKPLDIDAEIDRRTQERSQQAAESEAVEHFTAFSANNEFADFLRPQMGKAIESGWVGGETTADLIKNAYDFCVRNNTEIQEVLAGRAAQQGQVAVPAHTRQAPQPKPVAQVKPGLAARNSQPTRQTRVMSAREAAAEAAREMGLE